jgi:hypothetical protein
LQARAIPFRPAAPGSVAVISGLTSRLNPALTLFRYASPWSMRSWEAVRPPAGSPWQGSGSWGRGGSTAETELTASVTIEAEPRAHGANRGRVERWGIAATEPGSGDGPGSERQAGVGGARRYRRDQAGNAWTGRDPGTGRDREGRESVGMGVALIVSLAERRASSLSWAGQVFQGFTPSLRSTAYWALDRSGLSRAVKDDAGALRNGKRPATRLRARSESN